MEAGRGWIAAAALAFLSTTAFGAQLSGDARSAIPKDIQQIIVVDYRAMQNSPAAMSLRDKVVPPELKRLETALKQSGFKVESVTDVLAFAAFRTNSKSTATRTIGIAQGQFPTSTIIANMTKAKVKPTAVRNNNIYPMGSSGMSVAFLNQTTMVFGDVPSVRAALDARDGFAPNFLANGEMMNEMIAVDKSALWSLLDQKGTQVMMRNVLGEAAQLADYDTVKNRMKDSRYTMDFSNGVKFDMAVVMSDTVTAATAATLMKGMVLMRKSTDSSSSTEKDALAHTSIDSNAGTLLVDYSASDSEFSSLLSSPLFLQVVH
ncbi:MAG: hypothetical protein JSS87_13915 [Acidobacteria bacterium]|nr:hypothetical protein [Acidobacteriota bacterium]